MNEQDYTNRLMKAEVELHEKRVHRKQSHTLLFKLLRLLGFKVRLPHYSNHRVVLVYSTLYFVVSIGALMWFIQRQSDNMTFASFVSTTLISSILFGAIMTGLNIHNKKKYDLTPWEDL